MNSVDFSNYTAKKFITSEYDKLVKKIKEGTKESSSLNTELKDTFYSQREDIFATPEVKMDSVSPEDIEEGKIVATDSGFLILNNGDSFVLLGKRRKLDVPQEIIKGFEDIAKAVNKGEELTPEEEDTLAELREVGIIKSSALNKVEVLKKFKAELEEKGCQGQALEELMKLYIEKNGEAPSKPLKLTQKIITDLSFSEAEKLDRNIGLNFFTRLYELGYDKPKEERVYRGLARGTTFNDLISNSEIFKDLKEDTKQKIATAEKLFASIDKALPTMGMSEKIEALEEINSFWRKEKNELNELDLSSFLKENKSNALFSPISMLKLDCDEKTPMEFKKITLDKRALLQEENLIELDLPFEKSINVLFYKADKNLDNIVIYAEFLKKIQEKEKKKQVQKGKNNGKQEKFLSL